MRKIQIRLQEQYFFMTRSNLKKYNNETCKNEIKHNDVKICSQISDSVSRKIDFTAYGLQRDHPQALGLLSLTEGFLIKKISFWALYKKMKDAKPSRIFVTVLNMSTAIKWSMRSWSGKRLSRPNSISRPGTSCGSQRWD